MKKSLLPGMKDRPVETNHNLLHLLDHDQNGIMSIDRDWIIHYCNNNCQKILGISSQNPTGKNLWENFPGRKDSKFYSRLVDAFEYQKPVCFEDYFPFTKHWVEVSAHPCDHRLSIYFKDINQKKDQEEAIAKIAERYDLLLDLTSEAFWEWEMGAQQAFWYGNKLEKLLGYAPSERGSVEIWENNVHPDDIESVKANFGSAVATGQTFFSNQYRIRKKDGEYIYVRDRGHILRDRNGNAIRVIGVMDDISLERHNNEALLQAKSEYQSLFDNAPLPQWIYDQETLVFLDVNKAAIEHYNYSRDEFFQMTILNIQPQADQNIIENNGKATNSQFINKGVRTHVKKNGEQISVEISLTAFRYRNKSAHLATINDITDSERTKLALKESEQKLSSMLESIGDGFISVDRNWKVTYWNRKAEELLGRKREEALGKHFWEDLYKDAVTLKSYGEYHRAMNENISVHFEDYYPPLRMWFDISAYPASQGISVYFRDITEKLKLQEQLIQEKVNKQQIITKATLEAQERERTEIGMELHDGVNQVLTTAKLYIENINYFPDQKDSFLNKSLALLQKSINEIRVLSKALVTPSISGNEFKEALWEMIKCYKELSLFDIDHSIEVRAEKIKKEIKLTIYRIIQEQLNNIVKYARASLVKVHVIQADGKLSVLIEDNGIGFDVKHRKSGLGLNNIKNRAELFNGNAKIDSEPGKGCKIEIAFPL